MKKLVLYGHPESGHSYKVKLLMDVSGIEYEYRLIDIDLAREERPEPFRSLSLARFGEVPLLTHGDDVYVQSNAILCFLARHLHAFAGQDQNVMARAMEWLFWEHNKIGLCLPHLRLARNFFPDQYPEGAVGWLQSRYDADVGRFAKELSDGRAFILGDAISIADFSLCGYIYWANQAEVSLPMPVLRWASRIAGLPGWKLPYALLSPEHPYVSYGKIRGELDIAKEFGRVAA
ncbi:glutathione S-transferase family protein [Paraburkholderia fungorum]|uniref:glutathione S-transferase family protein n=1 Tax=Paraburkholderia fungorum TaxID=134537 RepID=UPI0007C4C948|nr:glutathione S-transferase family protein [Paraburkholderia fungorum]